MLGNTAAARDFERYKTMLNVIDYYEVGECSIQALAAILRKIPRQLKRPGPNWKQEFFQACNVLDDCSAYFTIETEAGRPGVLPFDQQVAFDEALLNARRLLMNHLRN